MYKLLYWFSKDLAGMILPNQAAKNNPEYAYSMCLHQFLADNNPEWLFQKDYRLCFALNPEWVKENKIQWLANHHPKSCTMEELLEHNIDYMLCYHLEWLVENRLEFMIQEYHNYTCVITNPAYICKADPEWVYGLGYIQLLAKYNPEALIEYDEEYVADQYPNLLTEIWPECTRVKFLKYLAKTNPITLIKYHPEYAMKYEKELVIRYMYDCLKQQEEN